MEDKIIANDETIRDIVKSEIERLGNEADLNHIDVSGVTNMYAMFFHSKFNGDVSKWDVSNVRDMSLMFTQSPFNGDISNWDVGNVKFMYYMFNNSPFDKKIDMWNYNFELVEEAPERFQLYTTGSYTLIEKYVNALEDEKFDLAEKIKFKMKGAIKKQEKKHGR